MQLPNRDTHVSANACSDNMAFTPAHQQSKPRTDNESFSSPFFHAHSITNQPAFPKAHCHTNLAPNAKTDVATIIRAHKQPNTKLLSARDISSRNEQQLRAIQSHAHRQSWKRVALDDFHGHQVCTRC